jgi:hypothetical protein
MRGTILNIVIPFDESILFHKLVAHFIAFLTVVHTLGHYLNVLEMSNSSVAYNSSAVALAFKSGW